MCTNPIQIKNPNFRQTGKYLSLTTDVSSQYIRVPCGNCASCRFVKQTGLFQRMLIEAENSYIYFVTLTIENGSMHHFTINDEVFKVAKYSDFQHYVKRLRKYPIFQERGFRYVCCREYGKKHGRPHFHFLLFLKRLEKDFQFTPFELEKYLKKLLLDEWRRNIGTSLYPLYKPICQYHDYWRNGKLYRNFDCHLVQEINGKIDQPLFYVLKYMCKDSPLYKKMQACLFEKYGDKTTEYYKDLCLLKPKFWKSIGFGLDPKGTDEHRVADIIRHSLDLSKQEDSPYPLFIYRGYRFPLSRYYKSKFLTQDEVLYYANKTYQKYGKIVYDGFDPFELYRQYAQDMKRLSKYDDTDIFDALLEEEL